MRKLYHHPLSGPAHRARMLLSFLELEYEAITVDVVSGEQNKPEFRALNPRGKVPVLVEDDGTTIYDSHAIISYLARKHGGDDWLPGDAVGLGKVMQWISFSANEIHQGPYMARLNFLLDLKLPNIDAIQEQSKVCLQLMDSHLADREWLELGRPTIADVACFPPVALGEEGKLPLAEYKHVSAWIDRVKGLPRYVPMAGL